MKILWIYKHDPRYTIDNWFHLEYVRWMKRHGYDIVAYGPGIFENFSDIRSVPYDNTWDWEDLVTIIRADVAILNTKSRMFGYYSPHEPRKQFDCILPKGFEKSKKIPKVMIEEDFHYELNDDWYHEVGINLLLQRHYSQYLRKGKVKTLWHPFSVDTDTFHSRNLPIRVNKICFAGNITAPYPERKLLCEILQSKNLIDMFARHEKVGESYLSCLSEYVAHLSTSSIYNISAAKNFEIAASGSLLMTDEFPGIDLLFPANSYCSVKKDGSDVLKQAVKVLSEPDYVRETVNLAIKTINEKHSNRIRTKELMKILETEL